MKNNMNGTAKKEQELVNAWERLRFAYPNEIGGIENPWDEDFMLTEEASNAWKGVQKKYFSKHRESLRTYQDVLIESQDRRWDKIKRDFGTDRLVEEPVLSRRFQVPLINPPDDDHCNVIIEDHRHKLGYRRCPGEVSGQAYKNRYICGQHEHHIPCDICWSPDGSAFHYHVLSRSIRSTVRGILRGRFNWGRWLQGKYFPDIHIRTKQFLIVNNYEARIKYDTHDYFLSAYPQSYGEDSTKVSDFNVIIGKYWLCEECEQTLQKSLIRHTRKLGVIQALENRDIHRIKQAIKEVTKLIRTPKYRRQLQAVNTKREKVK